MKNLFFLLFLAPLSAWAGDISIDWTNPTNVESCTPAGLYDNPGGTRLWMLVADITDPAVATHMLTGWKPGDYVFTATSYDDTGTGSRISGVTTRTVTEFVTTGTVAYTILKLQDEFALQPVGTITLGVACDVNQSVNGKYGVSRDAVSWYGTVEPSVVVADCG
jgi:hypothetical protein